MNRPRFCVLYILLLALAVSLLAQESKARIAAPKSITKLGSDGTRFTINGQPKFLLGISYYGGLGASDETLRRDLDLMQKHGFNWLRLWATWAAFEQDVSAVDSKTGQPRREYLEKLHALLAECDRRGLVVDVTLSRGNGITGPARLQDPAAHHKAVETLVTTLKPLRNWYLDLANERNIKDQRFTSFAELKELRERVRQLDPERLVTASHAGDLSQDDVKSYLLTVGVDFLSPHRPRQAKSAQQTEAKSREYLQWMKDLGRLVPLHYQEPFRRGFGKYDPTVDDFLTDLRGARAGGAAGWCLHNGDQRDRQDGRPRRSFDLREGSLFEQLDEVERAFLKRLDNRP